MIIVSDTSALSNLAVVEHLWLLEAIYTTVIIPEVVAEELCASRNPIIASTCDLPWIRVEALTRTDLAESLQVDRGLDAGEACAIALAVELRADEILIDERLGRREAEKLGLSIVGVLGVLLVAKRRNSIAAIAPVVNDLIERAGFRVGNRLYRRVLELAGELEA